METWQTGEPKPPGLPAHIFLAPPSCLCVTLGKLLVWGHHPCFLKSPVDWDREGATMAKIGHWVEDTILTMAQVTLTLKIA